MFYFSMVDVIVTWEDGTENCVSLSELQTVNKDKKITLGAKVKMFYEEKWYYGTVTVTETSKGVKILPQKRHRLESSASDSSEDTVPLSVIKKNLKISNDNTGDPCGMSVNNTLQDNHKTSDEIIINYNVENDNITYCLPRVTTVIDYEDVDISDLDDPEYRPDILKHQELDLEETHYDRYIPQSCEVNNCQQEVFSSCFHCSILLCFDHFEENISNCTDFFFYLNYNNHPIKVCRKFFLNTLAISEKVMRTAVEKVNSTGILCKLCKEYIIFMLNFDSYIYFCVILIKNYSLSFFYIINSLGVTINLFLYFKEGT